MGLSERESSHLHLLGSYTSYFPSLPRYHVAIDQEKFVLTWRSSAVAVLGKEEEGAIVTMGMGRSAGEGRIRRQGEGPARNRS